MSRRLDRAVDLGRAVLREVRAEQLPFLAGSIAYHAFVSLLPLLVLALTAATTLGDTTLSDAVLQVTERVLTTGATDLLAAEVETASVGSVASVLGLVVLVWGTLRIFRGLDTAFSDVYETASENTFTDQMIDGLVVFATFTAAVLVAGATQNVLPTGGSVALAALRTLVGVTWLAVTFLPMYYVFPDTDVSVLEVIPGVVTAAVGLTLLQSLFRVYIALSDKSPTESALAGIVVLLTFLYFAGFTILLGCVVNAVFSNRSADVDVDPVIGGVPVDSATPQLQATLDAFEAASDEGGAEVVVGGKSVSMPSPAAVRVQRSGDDTVGVELLWRQSSAADSADGGDDPPAGS